MDQSNTVAHTAHGCFSARLLFLHFFFFFCQSWEPQGRVRWKSSKMQKQLTRQCEMVTCISAQISVGLNVGRWYFSISYVLPPKHISPSTPHFLLSVHVQAHPHSQLYSTSLATALQLSKHQRKQARKRRKTAKDHSIIYLVEYLLLADTAGNLAKNTGTGTTCHLCPELFDGRKEFHNPGTKNTARTPR